MTQRQRLIHFGVVVVVDTSAVTLGVVDPFAVALGVVVVDHRVAVMERNNVAHSYAAGTVK